MTTAELVAALVVSGITLRELRDLYTTVVLKREGGNLRATATILGCNRRTLYRRGVKGAGARGISLRRLERENEDYRRRFP